MENELQLLPDHMPEVERRRIPLHELPPNNRLLGPAPTKDLIDSVRIFGLLQPLVVGEKDDQYHIHGGRRRLKTLRLLDAEWDAREDTEEGNQEGSNPFAYADCYVVDDDGYTSHQTITILLNSTASPNPVAELEAIEALIKQGHGKEEICKVTGLRKSTVDSRLRLSNLHSTLRGALTDGKMTPGTADHAARLSGQAQKRLAEKYLEGDKITGKDVDEQRQARTQAAASSVSLESLSNLPGVDSLLDLSKVSADASVDNTASDPAVVEATEYLRDRVQRVSEDGLGKVKWSRKDVEAVRTLLGGKT